MIYDQKSVRGRYVSYTYRKKPPPLGRWDIVGKGVLSAQRPRSCKIVVPPPSQGVPERWDWYSFRLVAFRAPSRQSLPTIKQANSSRHLPQRGGDREHRGGHTATLPLILTMAPVTAERGLEQMSKGHLSAPRRINREARVGRSGGPRCDDANQCCRPVPAVITSGPGRWFGFALTQVTDAVHQRLGEAYPTVSSKEACDTVRHTLAG